LRPRYVGGIVKTFLRYLWWISVSVVQLAIFAFVFAHLKDRMESIVVSVLGLLYVTIRSIAIVQTTSFAQFAVGVDGEIIRIRELLGDDHETIQARINSNTEAGKLIFGGKMIVTSIFLGVVGLFCLVVLFGAID